MGLAVSSTLMLALRKLGCRRRTPRTKLKQIGNEIAEENEEILAGITLAVVPVTPAVVPAVAGVSGIGGPVVPVCKILYELIAIWAEISAQNPRIRGEIGKIKAGETQKEVDNNLEHQIHGTKPQKTQQNERSIQGKFGAIFWGFSNFLKEKFGEGKSVAT